MKKSLSRISIALLFAIPSLIFRIYGISSDPVILAFVFGIGIVVSAILLSWAAEAAQIDISSSFAVAILALIAVLPEYAVDLYFSFTAGSNHEFTHYAAANMTGSNRLLIGIGWPAVVIAFVFAQRFSGKRAKVVILKPKIRVELAFLAIACIYSTIIPLFKKISLIDAAVLIPLFLFYMIKVSNEEQEDIELIGTPAGFKTLKRIHRFFSVNALFLIAGFLVAVSAQPFADSLIGIGKEFHLDEFLLVQWLAPFATEAPELIVAVIYSSRNREHQAMGTLLSSKINQWTLLIGSIPIAYYLGGGGNGGLILDVRQNEEFILTAAQSIMGFAFLCNLRFSLRDAIILLGLFLVQFVIQGTNPRLILSAAYILISIILLVQRRKEIGLIGKSFFTQKHI